MADTFQTRDLPLVSICCLTYNHKEYIRKALDGFLAQQCDFPIEVIVHDDASSDGTAAIIQEYALKHPGIIRPILQRENQYSKGLIHVLEALYGPARGRYIAVCEGDDHWIDPLKLRKQVEAMEADQHAMGCFTDAWNERNGQRSSYLDGIYAVAPKGPVLNQLDMVLGQGVPSCTLMCRREQLLPLPEAYNRSPVGDTLMFVHLTQRGHLLYMPEKTAVRNMHPGGVHSLSGRMHRIKIKEQVWPLLDEMTNGRYHVDILRMFSLMYSQEWDASVHAGDRKIMRYVWPQMAKRRKAVNWSIRNVVVNMLHAWLPLRRDLVDNNQTAKPEVRVP